eukprot:Nitzschia sp. Nitz4//scaffold5_size260463//138958//140505//NITZ4_000989-RA/size260463-processed-gene-0.78-mRNA-1//1//CDS//3329555361//6353//frame0
MSTSPYAPAANLLNKVLTERKGLKSVAYNSKGEPTCSKTAYAQCVHVLQHKPILEQLVKNLLADLPVKNVGLLYVLLYELLLGPNKKIRGGGALKRQLVEREDTLRAKLDEIHVPTPETTSRLTIPRYVRVNTIKASMDNILPELKELVSSLYVDRHVPNVLVLPPTPESRKQLQGLVSSNEVVLQDKSSCFSALCLVYGFETMMGPRTEYLDACAAPGNKTSHLASLLPKTAKVHAFDKSKNRFELLKRRMNELVGPKVQCHEKDFLETSSEDAAFKNVRAILLDPSCSGSGMTGNHQEASRDPEYCDDRVRSLSKFQLQALQHATSAFSIERVVYSTCSLYMEENEKVVQRFLASTDEWKVVSPICLKEWKRRGLACDGLSKEASDALVRVHPDEDRTNGFFVACFERVQSKVPGGIRSKATWTGPKLPKGLEFYSNQFDKQDEDEDNEVKVEATVPAKKATPKKEKGSKRKVDEVEVPSSEATVSKKRAKKMEWKKKQRQRKFERLQKTPSS